jgi:hypothetical protein
MAGVQETTFTNKVSIDDPHRFETEHKTITFQGREVEIVPNTPVHDFLMQAGPTAIFEGIIQYLGNPTNSLPGRLVCIGIDHETKAPETPLDRKFITSFDKGDLLFRLDDAIKEPGYFKGIGIGQVPDSLQKFTEILMKPPFDLLVHLLSECVIHEAYMDLKTIHYFYELTFTNEILSEMRQDDRHHLYHNSLIISVYQTILKHLFDTKVSPLDDTQAACDNLKINKKALLKSYADLLEFKGKELMQNTGADLAQVDNLILKLSGLVNHGVDKD